MLNPRSTQRLVMAAQARRIRELERQVVTLTAQINVLLYSEPTKASKRSPKPVPKTERRAASTQKVVASKLLHPSWTWKQVAADVHLHHRYCMDLYSRWQATTNVR